MSGKPLVLVVSAIVTLIAGLSHSRAGVLYPPPAGGWTYEYTGDLASGGADFTALDGTWSHNNGSDEWDESTIGAGNPGGANGGLTDGSTVYARFQDTGDPRDYGFSDPGSTRKLFFGHDISAEGASATVLDDGVTVSFRARVSTGDPLDDLYPDGGAGIAPWPAGGDGYGLHNGAKGNFTIKQQAGGAVAFSLALESDGATNPTGALVMNNLNGNAITGDVDTGDPGTVNEVALADPTAWQEFWINVAAGGTGTHQVSVYHDGSLTPTVYDVTAGDGSDYDGISYIAIGLGSTGFDGAVDVDSFAWSPGVIAPVPEPSTIVLAILALAGLAGFVRRSRS